MFNQTLRSICSFFTPGKKSIFSSAHAADNNKNNKQEDQNTDTQNVRVLYHRDINNIQTIETKPDSMQHDWWIN